MATQVRVPNFTPSVNALHFINAFAPAPVVTVNIPPFGDIGFGDASGGLCGGMVFTVCDIFETPGAVVPPDVTPPAGNTPLFHYIAGRLIDSFDLPAGAFLKYYDWQITPDEDTGWPPFFVRRGLAWKTIVEEWTGRIQPALNGGSLVPLGLVTNSSPNPADLGKDHQVLAYGYDLDDANQLSLLIYDPNTPQVAADEVRISLSIADPVHATPISHNVGINEPIRGFFAVDYARHDPTGLAPTAYRLVAAGPPRVGVAPVAPGGRELALGALTVTVRPARMHLGTPTQITVSAVDAATGKPVTGHVQLGNRQIARTDQAFSYAIFTSAAHGDASARAKVARERIGHVIAPGYLPAQFELATGGRPPATE